MATRFKVPVSAAEASRIEDDLWEAYYAEEISARGLSDGDSLYTRNGVRVSIPDLNRYVLRKAVPGFSGGVIEYDDRAQGYHGRIVRVRAGGTRQVIANDGVLYADLPQSVRDYFDGGGGQALRADDVGRRRFVSRGFDPGSVRRTLQRPFEGPSTLEWPTQAAMLLVALWSIVVLLARHCG